MTADRRLGREIMGGMRRQLIRGVGGIGRWHTDEQCRIKLRPLAFEAAFATCLPADWSAEGLRFSYHTAGGFFLIECEL